MIAELLDSTAGTSKPVLSSNSETETSRTRLRSICWVNIQYANATRLYFVFDKLLQFIPTPPVKPRTHASAALCIGRRFLGASERLPSHLNEIADGKGSSVTLPLPVRNRERHVRSLVTASPKETSSGACSALPSDKKPILKEE